MDWDKGEILWRAYNEKTGLWNMFAESIPMVEREYPLIVLQDEVLRRRLKKRPKVGTEISVDFAYVHASIELEKYERPISPLLFVTLDHASGMVLDMKMVNPEDSEIAASSLKKMNWKRWIRSSLKSESICLKIFSKIR